VRTLLAVCALCLAALPCRAADPPAKTDRYGDPLPVGALMRLGTLRNRAPITGFGIANDGTVVTVGPGADVRRWDPTDDKSEDPIQLPLTGSETSNNYPQVSPDGKLVAACSNEKVFVWAVPGDPKEKPKEVATFALARTRLFRFSPDGTRLVVTTQHSQFSTVHVCTIKTGETTTLECTPRYIEGVTFSGDGKRVGVVADADFYFLDALTGKQLAKYRPDGRVSSEFALNHAGDVLAFSVSFSGPKHEFRFIDPLTGKQVDGLTGPDGSIYWLTFTADGKTLLVGGRDGIRCWDPGAGKLIRVFEGLAAESYALQRTPARFSPDGKVLVAHNGAVLLRWNASTGKPLFPEQDIGHGGHVNGVGVSPDTRWIATRGMDNRVCVWDSATGKELFHAPAGWTNAPAIDFSPDGKFLYIGGPEWGEASKLDATTGKTVTKFVTDPKGPKQAHVFNVRVSGDGKTVFALSGSYSAADPGFVTVWNANSGERTRAIQLPARAAHGGDLSPGAEFVSIDEFGSGGVYAVDAPKKNLLEQTKLPRISLHGHFSDDGRWYTLIGMDSTGGVWAYSAVVVSTLNWGVACTVPMAKQGRSAISADGRTLATADGEKIEFFDTATARSLGEHRVSAGAWAKALFGYVTVLRFAPDGTKLISGHSDTTALVWPVPARPAKK
jgi:WD40 repeat protein